MSGYQTVIVGTDGSASSLYAVDRAGALAAQEDAKLIVATAYFPAADLPRRPKGGHRCTSRSPSPE